MNSDNNISEPHTCPSPGCAEPDRAAREAVRQVFAILGVDIDKPHEVEEFRKSLRFGDQVRKVAGKGFIAVFIAILTIATAAALAKLGVFRG